jgi:hypothetical protein
MLARYRRQFRLYAFLTLASLASPLSALAQTANTDIGPGEITLKPVVGFKTINQATGTLVSLLFLGAALLAFFYIVRGALKYVSAGDNAANAQAARTTIQNAVIGLFIIASVYVIFRLVIGLIPGLGSLFS